MAQMIEVKIQGLEGIEEKLRSAGTKLAAKALRRALRVGGNVLRDEIRARTPVETGILRKNVKLRVSVSAKREESIAKVGFGRQTVVARAVELGHRQLTHKKQGKKQVGQVPAHPFIRPAFEAAKQKAIDAFAQTIREALPVIATPGTSTSE